jgi:hypothetical protein
MMFAIAFLVQAESGEKRTSVIQQKEHATARLRIFDQNGQPAVSGVPAYGRDSMSRWGRVAMYLCRTQSNIPAGDTVR